MGKPRSEGNKNREIHQTVPDHRVKLTPEGHRQARDAGRRLRQLLKPDDTLHFFTSPYRRTRETTEGILQELTSDDPAPSPFPRHTIKVYEEPRLREQDFGNFQPSSVEMTRMWQQRADYGHFFFRIPNGESAADAYDRVAGFNESLWRSFSEPDFASVCILTCHGLMARVFLMKWFHWSVEFFEDLRNINHCEFVVMARSPETGKYVLRNQLRTWSQYRRELAEERKQSAANDTAASTDVATPLPQDTSPIPERKMWTGRQDSTSRRNAARGPRRPRRQNTEDLFRSDEEDGALDAPRSLQTPSVQPPGEAKRPSTLARAAQPSEMDVSEAQRPSQPPRSLTGALVGNGKLEPDPAQPAERPALLPRRPTLKNRRLFSDNTVMMLTAGRDGGGSRSGHASDASSSGEDDDGEDSGDGPHFGPHYGSMGQGNASMDVAAEHEASGEHGHTWLAAPKDEPAFDEGVRGVSPKTSKKTKRKGGGPRSMALALSGDLGGDGNLHLGAMADALGDQSQDEADLDDQVQDMKNRERSFESSVR